ncbi:MAG: twin-arginine translocase TatA/TatE family subunit [Olsenella profusa]
MFGIGETEFAIIVLFAFLIFGPDKLPGMGRTIGRALRQFRDAQEGFSEVVQNQVMDPLNDAMADPKAQEKDRRRASALEEDADLENESVPTRRANETFAERKARLEAERMAKEKAEGTAGAAPTAPEPPVVAQAPEDTPASATPQEAPAEASPHEAMPDTSAAALYALKPERAEPVASDGMDLDDGSPAGATEGEE